MNDQTRQYRAGWRIAVALDDCHMVPEDKLEAETFMLSQDVPSSTRQGFKDHYPRVKGK